MAFAAKIDTKMVTCKPVINADMESRGGYIFHATSRRTPAITLQVTSDRTRDKGSMVKLNVFDLSHVYTCKTLKHTVL